MARKSKSKFDPEAFLAKADGGRSISKYSKGQVIFAQGDPADSVLYIREGGVKISVVSAQGKEAVVAFLKAGDFIGEGCLTGRPRRVSAARATEDSVITRVDKVTMVRVLREQLRGCPASPAGRIPRRGRFIAIRGRVGESSVRYGSPRPSG